jgi:hypothetical protein
MADKKQTGQSVSKYRTFGNESKMQQKAARELNRSGS